MNNEIDTPCPFVGVINTNTRGKVTVQPSYTVTIAPLDVEKNLMHLTGIEKYSFVEHSGKIYRVTEQGKLIGPPIEKEKFEKMKKMHKERLDREK